METQQFPRDGARVRFTDMQDIEHKGVYRKEKNGYEEVSEVELAAEPEFIFPEGDVVKWEYMEEEDQ